MIPIEKCVCGESVEREITLAKLEAEVIRLKVLYEK